MMAELLDMDVVNNSIYDWATALGEAALMCVRLNKRKKFLIPEIIAPDRYKTLLTYTKNHGIKIDKISYEPGTGKLDLNDLKSKLDEDTTAVYIENPSYLGVIEDQVDEISTICHENKSLFVVGIDPTSLGLLRPPGAYDADIVVGEGQPLGNPINFGGPLLGIFACKEDRKMIRQLPGRLIGITTSISGDEIGYVMTLSSREQHIKREKATSNICTNEGLLTIAAAIYMASLGKNGFIRLSKNIFYNTQYLIKKINEFNVFKSPIFTSSHFKEFTLQITDSSISTAEFQKKLFEKGLIVGKDISSEFSNFENTLLLCTTEVHMKKDLDFLIKSIKEVVE